jgi:lysophospholipase L1-like esterase
MSGRVLPLLALVPLLAAAAAAQAPDPGSDWAQLLYYRDADRSLPLPSPGKPRVVFLGDSITQSWNLADVELPGVEVLNRGISGQTTPQMLVRFRQDVVDLQPAAVHILAGTNDLAGNTGPTSLEAIENNLSSMVEIAAARSSIRAGASNPLLPTTAYIPTKPATPS